MHPIKLMKFWRQFTVLVQRNLRLILNDKLTMASLILQAPFMVLVIKMVVDPDCFTSNLINIGSRTALFIISAMAAFMGTLNSYREICKEREIILREASVGVSLLAVVLSKAFVLLLIEDVQAAILTFGFVRIVHIPQILFTLTGVAAQIAAVIVCRWGMGALGASTDLNSRLAWLKQGFDSPMYDATVANLMHSWQMMGLITVVCLIAAWLVLQISFNRRKA